MKVVRGYRTELDLNDEEHTACLKHAGASRFAYNWGLSDRFYPSSKTCSGCGWLDDEQTLADRTFICKECSMVLDRDENAAKNILSEALRTTASSAGSHAYGERSAGNANGHCETALVEVGTNQHDGERQRGLSPCCRGPQMSKYWRTDA